MAAHSEHRSQPQILTVTLKGSAEIDSLLSATVLATLEVSLVSRLLLEVKNALYRANLTALALLATDLRHVQSAIISPKDAAKNAGKLAAYAAGLMAQRKPHQHDPSELQFVARALAVTGQLQQAKTLLTGISTQNPWLNSYIKWVLNELDPPTPTPTPTPAPKPDPPSDPPDVRGRLKAGYASGPGLPQSGAFLQVINRVLAGVGVSIDGWSVGIVRPDMYDSFAFHPGPTKVRIVSELLLSADFDLTLGAGETAYVTVK